MKKHPKFVAFMAAVLVLPLLGNIAPAQAAILPAPSLSSPTSDQILTNYPRNATFNWSAVSGANHYQLEIACDTCVSQTNLWANAKTYTVNGTSYTTKVPGADNQFRWRVRAYDSLNTAGTWSGYRYFRYKTSTQTSSDKPLISKPQVAQQFNITNIDLDWSDVANAFKYNYAIEKWNGSSQAWEQKVNQSTPNSSSNASFDAGNYGGGQYRFRVRANYSNSTYGVWSDWRYFYSLVYYETQNDAPEIYSPVSNVLVENTSRNVYLSWENLDATGFQIEVVSDISGTQTYTASNNTSYNYYASGNDNWYHFRVRAQYGNGDYGPWSEYRYFQYRYSSGGGNNYSAPAINNPWNGQTFTDHNVSFGWSSVSGCASYEVNVNYESNNNWYEEGTYSATGLSYNKYFSYDNHYRVRVRGKFSDGNYTNWSDWREFTIGYSSGQYGYLGVPAITMPNENQTYTGHTVAVSWWAVSGAGRYEIQAQYESNSNWYDEGYHYSDSASYQLYLGYDNHYRLRVRAVNGSNYGNWSDWRTFYIGSGSGQYYNLTAPILTAPSEGQSFTSSQYVTVSWYNVSNASTYELQTQYESGGNWYDSNTYTTSYTNYQIYLSSSNHYRVRVRAVNGSNYGNWSDWRTFYTNSGSSYGSAPTIYAPTDNQYYSINSAVNVNWNSLSNVVRYEVGFEYKSGTNWFTEGVYTTTNNSYSKQMNQTNAFRVRVRAYFNNSSYGDWSAYRYFSVGTQQSVNGVPQISTPYVNQVFSNGYVVVDWDDANMALSYEMRVEYQSGGNWYTETSYTSLTNSYQQLNLLQRTNYRVRIRAMFVHGAGNWSEDRYFSVQ